MFLRNTWYAAGWSENLRDEPVRIKILNQAVALYRLADGTPVALADRCPHRFAPLSSGKIVDDTLQCPYHGLRFDRNGACALNPHGDGTIPPRARVDSFPLVERHHALWIWMGDADKADPSLIPDMSIFDGPELAPSRGYLNPGTDYQLVNDNLLDLTHAAYLHPFLAPADLTEKTRTDVKQEGRNVLFSMGATNVPATPLMQLIWDRGEEHGDLYALMRWHAPSNLLLDTGMHYLGSDTGPATFSAHLLTPETEKSTHYFWMVGRNRLQDNAEISAIIHNGIQQAFQTEDEPMLALVAENMEGIDFWDLNPAILPTDGAGIRARRLLAKMIREDNGATAMAADAGSDELAA